MENTPTNSDESKGLFRSIFNSRMVINQATTTNNLWQPWLVLLTLYSIAMASILVVLACGTLQAPNLLTTSLVLTIGAILIVSIQQTVVFGGLWLLTRMFGARKSTRKLAVAFPIVSRGPALCYAIQMLIVVLAILTTPQSVSSSIVGLFCGFIYSVGLFIFIWWSILLGKMVRAIYELSTVKAIATIVLGVFILPGLVPNNLIDHMFVEAFSTPSGSMIPKISRGDRFLVNKVAYGLRLPFTSSNIVEFGIPQRGDLVIYEDSNKQEFIKRVVAVANDTVEIRQGLLFINGRSLTNGQGRLFNYEEYSEDGSLRGIMATKLFTEKNAELSYPVINLACKDNSSICPDCNKEYGICDSNFNPVTVPEGHVFVLGDNRDNSLDSRHHGFIALEKIKGQATYIFWPLSRVDSLYGSI
jgi:signal peptidase I